MTSCLFDKNSFPQLNCGFKRLIKFFQAFCMMKIVNYHTKYRVNDVMKRFTYPLPVKHHDRLETKHFVQPFIRGEEKTVCLVSVLAMVPAVLLLDEPARGVEQL